MAWHGYVVMEKPAVLSGGEWVTVVQALRSVLGTRNQSSMPAWRLHWRLSLDGSKVLFEGLFDVRDLDVEDLTRLCRYISEALGGKYSPEEVREGLRSNVTIMAPGGRWSESRAACHAYITPELSDWEEGGP